MDPVSRPRRVGRRALLLSLLSSGAAAALGRVPYGGKLRLSVPYALPGIDPHDGEEPIAALLAHAVADPLFALDARQRPYPALAAALPEATSQGTRVELRGGLRTARGRTLDARDVVFSLRRAHQKAAAGLIAPVGPFEPDRADARTLWFRAATPEQVTEALSSPLTAILPRGFSVLSPDGTGAFRAQVSRERLLLERNPNAARGPAFLDGLEVRPAADLSQALRAFEVSDADVGWLGAGLYRARPGAVGFDAGVFGWLLLATGKDAAAWGAPGVAQQLVDGLALAPLAPLGVRAVLPAARGARWGGGAASLLVAEDPHLVQIAHGVAGQLGTPAHPIRVVPTGRRELSDRRRRGSYELMLRFVRPLQPSARGRQLTLLSAVDPRLAEHPPRAPADLRDLLRTLPVGLLGELRLVGAHAPDVHGLGAWQLGDVYRTAT